MTNEDLRPLLSKLEGYDRLCLTLPDDLDIWLEIIDADNRSGRNWSAYAVIANNRSREFRSFNRLPESLHALLGDLALPTDLTISFSPDDWQYIDPPAPRGWHGDTWAN